MAWKQWNSPDSERARQLPYIEIPIYSEEKNDGGDYDIIGYRREYVN